MVVALAEAAARRRFAEDATAQALPRRIGDLEGRLDWIAKEGDESSIKLKSAATLLARLNPPSLGAEPAAGSGRVVRSGTE